MWAGLVLLGFGARVKAATLLGSVNTSPSSPANLTTEGALDWSVWDVTSGTGVSSPLSATNTKSSSPHIISTLASVSGGTLRGSTNTSTENFSYTDGTSPSSLASTTQGLVFESTLNTLGRGLDLKITGDPTTLRRVEIWATGYDGTGTLTATLNGVAVPLTLASQAYVGGTKTPTLFTLDFQPDNAADLLDIQYTLTSKGTSGNAHVAIQAVAVSVSPAPEPTTAMLFLGGLGGLALRRKRR